MDKHQIPQDPSALDKFTRELCYAVDDTGKYVTGLSRGWQIKADALGITWQDAQQRISDAKQKVLQGTASPILYFMEVHLMDLPIISAYTGFWQITVKRHLKPEVFKNLSEKKLQNYAEIFQISVEDLKNPNLNGS